MTALRCENIVLQTLNRILINFYGSRILIAEQVCVKPALHPFDEINL